MTLHRRDVLRSGIGAASLALADKFLLSTALAADPKLGYTLPPLPYAYDALLPHVDTLTMQIHHDKHHAAYVDNLNKALADHPALKQKDPITLLREISTVPEPIRQTVINNAGGHVNHSLFWQMMAPSAGGVPTGELAKAIDAAFGSFDKFKAAFSEAGMKRFGSGWAWLVVGPGGKLEITSSPNQDSPFMTGSYPILGLDVWEHAYYLKHQNKRADYIQAWWNVVNWPYVAKLYEQAKS
jgi:superoxide dismutase, Fe-Mn family